MKAIYRRELKSYFTGMTGYVFIAFMLLFAGVYTMAICLKQAYPNFEYVLANMSFCFFIIVPVITMKVVSEEKRQRTDQLLYSLPITTTDVILGKYFALLTVLAVPLLLFAFYPLILSLYGSVHYPASYGAIIAFFFMGAAFMAIGLYISSLTESQMIAAGLCFAVLLVNYFLSSIASLISVTASVSFFIALGLIAALALILYLMTKSAFISLVVGGVLIVLTWLLYYSKPSVFEGLAGTVLGKLSLFEHYYTFMAGSFDLKEIVFFVSASVLFVFLSVQSMEKKRWS